MKTIVLFGLISAFLAGIECQGGRPDRVEYTTNIMKDAGIIPDVVSQGALREMSVIFGNKNQQQYAHFGNKIHNNFTKEKPYLMDYGGRPDEYYTLIITTPDVPNRQYHRNREVIHFLQVNIPGNDWKNKGSILVDWWKLDPPLQGGQRRFVSLVYEQNGKQYFNFTRIPKDILNLRRKFSTQKFIEENHFDKNNYKAHGFNWFEATKN